MNREQEGFIVTAFSVKYYTVWMFQNMKLFILLTSWKANSKY
jgi:hypothetical protein